MSQPICYLNGRVIPLAEAALPLHDAGFVSGATIVDNARTFHRQLFHWPDHLERFRRDCRDAFVPLRESDEKLTAIATELIEHNSQLLPNGAELQLVTFATPGPLGLYLGQSGVGPATLGMLSYPLPLARFRPFFTDGVVLAVAGTQSSQPDDLLPPRIKHRSRLHWHIADRRVNEATRATQEAAIPVILNRHGIGDTAIGSIVAVRDGTLIIPEPDTVLDAISLKVLAGLCTQVGLSYRREAIDLRGIGQQNSSGDRQLSELMLTGTGFCLAGVRRWIDGSKSRDFVWPGPIQGMLLTAWSDSVQMDIAKQFLQSS